MKLLTSILTNFKRTEKFTFSPNGKNSSLLGRNATGKTTVFDATKWLLFGKDSLGKSRFGIKRQNPDGSPINGIECSVENHYEMPDGKVTKLKKVVKEVYGKIRGVKSKDPTDHKISYYINGDLIKKKADYDNFISKIADEKIFNLLTDPLYFGGQMEWKDRRSILTNFCGDVTDKDVIASTKELSALPELLNDLSAEDKEFSIKDKINELSDEKDGIVPKIEEKTADLDALPPGYDDAEDLKTRPLLGKEIQDATLEYLRIQSGGEVAELNKQLAEAETNLLNLQNARQEELIEDSKNSQEEISSLQTVIDNTDRKAVALKERITDIEGKLSKNVIGRDTLVKEYCSIRDKKFGVVDSDCSLCGADPEHQVNFSEEKFNLNRADRLSLNETVGLALKASTEELNSIIAEHKSSIADHIKSLTPKRARLTVLFDQKVAESGKKDSPEIVKAVNKIDFLNGKIELLSSNNSEALLRAGAKVDRLEEKLRVVNERLKAAPDKDKINGRIKELKADEKRLAKEIEALHKDLDLVKLFNVTKSEMLEKKINSKFFPKDYPARFKLFSDPKAGDRRECCDIIYKGAFFGKELNSGHESLVGIHIINVLSDFYNFYPCMFVDHAESITEKIETKAQNIQLVCSKGHWVTDPHPNAKKAWVEDFELRVG